MNREQGLVRHGAVGWGAWAASVLGARAYARWAAHDPAPFVHGVRELVVPRLARMARTFSRLSKGARTTRVRPDK
jgi:uncharacterized protein YbjT (DUF2867 family)